MNHPLGNGRLCERPVGLRGRRVRFDENVRDGDVGPRPGQRECVGATEPARPARHESNPAGEVDLERHAAILCVLRRLRDDEFHLRCVPALTRDRGDDLDLDRATGACAGEGDLDH